MPLCSRHSLIRLVQGAILGENGDGIVTGLTKVLSSPAYANQTQDSPGMFPPGRWILGGRTRRQLVEFFEDCKSCLGRAQDETRSWVGWNRHMTLAGLAHQFVTLVRKCLQRSVPQLTFDRAVRSMEEPELRLAREDRVGRLPPWGGTKRPGSRTPRPGGPSTQASNSCGCRISRQCVYEACPKDHGRPRVPSQSRTNPRGPDPGEPSPSPGESPTLGLGRIGRVRPDSGN